MNSINFDRPYLLIVGAVLLIGLIASFAFAVRKDNVSHKNITSFVMHIIMIILIALTMAHTTLERVMTETNVYVVCDLSYSTHNSHDKIDSAIDMVKDQSPKNTKIGVIGFGKDPVLHVRMGEMMRSIRTCNVDESETNIAQALEYAGSLFESNVIKRIVLITDGLDTSSENIVSVVNDLSKKEVYIDAIFIDSNLQPYEETLDSKGNVQVKGEKEVQLSQIDFNEKVYINSDQTVSCLIDSTNDIDVIIELFLNGSSYKLEPRLKLNKGLNTYTFKLDTSLARVVNYEIKIRTEEDSLEINNSMKFSQEVSDDKRVLFISHDKSDAEAAKELFDSNVRVDYYHMPIGEIQMEVPTTVDELCRYDEIVLSNVDVTSILNSKTFVNSLDTVVGKYGKSLITLGNTYIGANTSGDESGADANALDVLSEMLPVRFGDSSDEQRNIAIVFDVSSSMYGENIFTNSKKLLTQLINTMSEKDSITLVSVHEKAEVIAANLTGTKENREYLLTQMNKLGVSNGTLLEGALRRINDTDLLGDPSITNKQIIIISDGLEGSKQPDPVNSPIVKVSQELKDNGFRIICCKMGISYDATAGKLLENVASENCYYKIVNEFNLKIEDVYEDLNETKFENVNLDIITKLANDINIRDVELNGQIHGIYTSRPKAGAKVVYETTIPQGETNLTVPVFAYKYYGNGKVTSITTDVFKDSWGSVFTKTAGGKKLLTNIIENSTPEVKVSSPFIINIEKQASGNLIKIETDSFQPSAKAFVRITDEQGNSKKYNVSFDSVNYLCYVDPFVSGNYLIEFDYTFGKNHFVSTTSYYENYALEYDRFQSFKASNLRKCVLNGELINLGEILNIENQESKTLVYVYDFTPALMIAFVSLFVLDIGLRKLTMKDIKSLFGKGKEEAKRVN